MTTSVFVGRRYVMACGALLALVLAVTAALPALAENPLPHVVVLATGGTIASQVDAETGALKVLLTGEELVEAVPGLGQVASLTVEQVANVGSRDITPEIWRDLADRANTVLGPSQVSGVVVVHGTDTLEETAYFLDLAVDSSKPVVVVGAQRAASDFDTDGPRNLLDAVRVAVSPEARGMGTLVVMNGQINAARNVTKTSTVNVESFKTPEFGPLGVADIESVRFYRAPLRRQTISLREEDQLGRVEIVTEYAGSDGRAIRLLLDDGNLDGLVIAGLGSGHVTSNTMAAIEEARAQGVPVVISTRVHTGRIVALYDNNYELEALGCINADNLTPQKARILLMLAMTRSHDPAELQSFFDQ